MLGFVGMIAAERLCDFVVARVLLGLGSGCIAPAVRRIAVTRDPARAGEPLGIMAVFEFSGFLLGPVLASAARSALGSAYGVRRPRDAAGRRCTARARCRLSVVAAVPRQHKLDSSRRLS